MTTTATNSLQCNIISSQAEWQTATLTQATYNLTVAPCFGDLFNHQLSLGYI